MSTADRHGILVLKTKGKKGVQFDEESFPNDAARKKGRTWVFTAQILATPASDSNPLCLLMWTMSC